MDKRAVGKQYEQLAKKYLYEQGCIIIEENFRCQNGEIDLIVLDGQYLVFVEVKYRKNSRMGTPEDAVGNQKQRKIRKVAAYYMYCRHYPADAPCRFDVVSILGTQIRWIRNAF